MKINSLISLLHIADPTLPIGGYSHSNGLETYVQKGLVNSVETAALFLNNMLSSSVLHNDAAYVRLAYEAMKQEDNYTQILILDEECSAMKSPREIREASHKLGTRLLKIFIEEGNKCDFLTQFGEYVTKNISVGNYPVVYGVLCYLMDIPLKEALAAFYFSTATGMVTNAVKLVPLGQLDGQKILFEVKKNIDKWVKETMKLEEEKIGLSNVGFDLRSMQHERLYSRLYMS
ncbi:MAG: urease accessory protein UreF [Flavobacteriaceae bacterium]|nr:urease accessory protein UreF [Flavobacteriaceae bacterium]